MGAIFRGLAVVGAGSGCQSVVDASGSGAGDFPVFVRNRIFPAGGDSFSWRNVDLARPGKTLRSCCFPLAGFSNQLSAGQVYGPGYFSPALYHCSRHHLLCRYYHRDPELSARSAAALVELCRGHWHDRPQISLVAGDHLSFVDPEHLFFLPVFGAFAIYLTGSASFEVLQFVLQNPERYSDSFIVMIRVLHYLLPNFAAFDFQVHAVYALPMPWGELGLALCYALTYGGVVLLISSFLLRRREL